MQKPHYRRILLKLSGEALVGSQKYGVDFEACQKIAVEIRSLIQLGVQIGIVIGGGNIFRGINAHAGMCSPADQIGMLATLINGIALNQAFETMQCESRIMSAIHCNSVAESYSWRAALEYLEKGIVLIFVGGTGNPYFTTDSAAALKALEINAEIMLKATKVDGIYNKDPVKYSDAIKFDRITYSEILAKQLGVMDAAAIVLCRENRLPIRVINIFSDNMLKRAVLNESVGTLVEEGEK